MNVGPNVELGHALCLTVIQSLTFIVCMYCMYKCVLVTKKKKYTRKIKNVM